MTAPLPKTVVTEREGDTTPDVRIVTMPIWKMVGVRTLRVYLQSLVGFLLATGTGAAEALGVSMPAGSFGVVLLSSASLAVMPATITLLQNTVELLTKMDITSPTLRA